MLKLTQQEFETVPLIVKIEILVAAVTCMWGTKTALSTQVQGQILAT